MVNSSTAVTALLVALILNCFSATAWGWGEDGHRVTGEIAWRLLDSSVQEPVQELLDVKGEGSLAEAATWADRIRGDGQYDWAAPLHYISLPRHWPGYQPGRDCPEQGCILEAIAKFRQILADPDAPQRERAEALLFIVHFVGDLHQPLHTGLATDRGGNDVEVEFFGFGTNLHALWDVFLPGGFLTDWQAYAEKQAAGLGKRRLDAWRRGTPEDWAAESHQLVHEYAYTESRVLGEDYYLRNRPIIERRLQQAGVRLAALLNNALASARQ
ncbi:MULTISPECIES: S1/P1 nuclease [Microbulbifer]|uniref:S1/P1 nuclease n=1 Tax=Microbulbifer TaxID=48073 RepID=UPI001F39D32A|nr:S1/P1 nuclease [Microbulbifer zhoushanensis]